MTENEWMALLLGVAWGVGGTAIVAILMLRC